MGLLFKGFAALLIVWGLFFGGDWAAVLIFLVISSFANFMTEEGASPIAAPYSAFKRKVGIDCEEMLRKVSFGRNKDC